MQYSKVFSTLIVGVLAGIQACNAQSYRLYAETSETLNTVYTMVSWVNSADGNEMIIMIGYSLLTNSLDQVVHISGMLNSSRLLSFSPVS